MFAIRNDAIFQKITTPAPNFLLVRDRIIRNFLVYSLQLGNMSSRSLANILTELLFPTHCVSCKARGALICENCLSKLSSLDKLYCVVCGKAAVGGFTHPGCATRYTPERALSGFWYRGPVRAVIKALKYKGIWPLAKTAAKILLDDLEEKGAAFGREAVVVPVPLSFWRRGKRGYNQAELLARGLGEQLELPVRVDLLKRVKDTPSQTGLDRRERAKNVKGAFAAGERINGEDILLVDDVATTGATAIGCSRTLKKAGAGQVWVMTFAKD